MVHDSLVRAVCRVGLIGDIHCEDEVLARVLQHLHKANLDAILAVGDMVDGSGDVNRVCSLLAQHGVLTVAGNHDRWLLEGKMRELPDATPGSTLRSEIRSWLEHLPKTISLQTPKGPLLLCHGLSEDDMADLRPDDEGYALESNLALQDLLKAKRYRFVVNGHSHVPMVKTIGQMTIINAGTLDRRHRQVFSVIDFERGIVDFFDAFKTPLRKVESLGLSP